MNHHPLGLYHQGITSFPLKYGNPIKLQTLPLTSLAYKNVISKNFQYASALSAVIFLNNLVKEVYFDPTLMGEGRLVRI